MPAGARGGRDAATGTPGRRRGSAGHREDLQEREERPPGGAAGRDQRRRQGRPARHRHRLAAAHRRRDRGHPAGVERVGSAGRRLHPAASLLHLQERLRRGRRVLPPAVPELRGDQPRPPGRPHRPHRSARAAHRWPREDRHVHRAAPAARRRAHHHHHPVPGRRGAPVHRDARQRRLAAPAAGGRHRPAGPGAGRRAGRLGGRGRPAGHPDQQRRADRPPIARCVRAAGGRGVRPAAGRPAARAA